MKRLLLFIFNAILIINVAYATHNRAGQIVYRHISGYTYEVTIWTYTYSLSQADRDSLEIHWGDGTTKWLKRNKKTYLPDYYIENRYQGIHTYPGPGTFKIYMEDPNRNQGVLNIPNSVNTVFALTTTLQINPFVGQNNAAILTTRPIDKAAKGQIFIHNPGAYDPDGDSLSYKMDTCRYTDGKKIPGFTLPPATDSIYVNPITGDLVWDTPPNIGIYNVAMRIEEWRHGVKISQIIRDIQIEVEETDNKPPVLKQLKNVCVYAGDTVSFNVSATDPDNDNVYLTASGGPFWVDTLPAVFPDSTHGKGSVTAKFFWQTNCAHVLRSPYVATFKATDDNPEVKLVDYATMKIKVVGPPVQFTSIAVSNNNIILNWNKSTCTHVKGYKIYRRNSDENFSADSCVTGVPPSWGYKLIATINNRNTDTYIDKALAPGFRYCYRIVAIYNNDVDGIASKKICIELAKGLPILTKASILQTATDTGSIRIEWIKPLKINTSQYPGPYRYLLSASRDLYGVSYANPVIFNSLNDTTYTDKSVDTKTTPSCYKLQVQSYDTISHQYVDIGAPAIASTPFLKINSANKRNILRVEENVPWALDTIIVYRYNENTSTFDSIGYTTSDKYVDSGLKNLKEYCYKVKTISHYSAEGMPNPIINYSQIACGTPIDTIPPCCPDFKLVSQCDQYRNKITWTMPADSCYESLAKIKIYYSDNAKDEPQFLASISPSDTVFYHEPENSLAGCYIVTAVDSAGNESSCRDNKQCIDVCNYYKLPNVFTPNADNVNDLYHPLPYKFVDHVNMKIYNRWGNLVFQTDDPDINWDGKDMNTGKMVPDGVYYYICDVYQKRLTGIIPHNISGFIHVFTHKQQKTP